MATHNIVTDQDLDVCLEVVAGKLTVKLDGTLEKKADGSIGITGGAITVVSTDGGNLISAGGDGGAFLSAADVQAVESAWVGTSASGALVINAGGTNGHGPSFSIDYTDTAFIEGVQDAVGQAILAGSGITYDDVADSISSVLGNLVAGNGIQVTGGNQISVVADPASPSTVTVGAAGISVTPGISADAGNLASLGTDNRVMVDPAGVTALATDTLCDLAGNPIADVFPG